jgi:hypothetical protein
MKVRVYCEETNAVGRDEGGWYRIEERPDVPTKLKRRMSRCAGCRNDFYNYRANITGNTCWSLDSDDNFRRRGVPLCHR